MIINKCLICDSKDIATCPGEMKMKGLSYFLPFRRCLLIFQTIFSGPSLDFQMHLFYFLIYDIFLAKWNEAPGILNIWRDCTIAFYFTHGWRKNNIYIYIYLSILNRKKYVKEYLNTT